MSRSEDKAKRWRVTILDLVVATTGIGVSLGLIRFALLARMAHEQNQLVELAEFAGVFIFGGTIGGSCGRVWAGTSNGLAIGFAIGGLSAFPFWAAWKAYFGFL